MSQIFEALRRTREHDRHGRASQRSAEADAVLATMGFASERKRSTRDRVAPVVLLLLLGVMAWLGWRWYAGSGTYPIAQHQPAPVSSVPPPVPADPAPTRLRPTPSPVGAAAPRTEAHVRSDPGSSRAYAPNARGTRKPPNPDSLQLALYYHRAGDFENALVQYRALLQRNELNAQTHNNLGLLYREKGMFEEAARHFQRALLVDARYTTARNNLGVVLLGQGRMDEARSEFARVLAQDARHVDAMVNLALVEKAAGRRDVAMETLVRAIAIDPRSPAAHYNLAVLYEQSGEPGRAADHYRLFLAHAGPEHAVRVREVRARLAELSGGEADASDGGDG